ncbi:MAG TPA: hypothetical protein VH599_22445 [Ktedonobacterales bacterium]
MRCGSATLLAGGAAGEQRERPLRSAAVPAAERSASDHAHRERLGLPAMGRRPGGAAHEAFACPTSTRYSRIKFGMSHVYRALSWSARYLYTSRLPSAILTLA